MYSIHAADAAAVLALCPFARSLQMAYCAAIGGSLSSLPVLSPLRGARQGPIGSRTGDADGGGDDDSKQWRARRDLRNRSGGSELGSEQAGRLAVARSAAGARGRRHRHHRDSGDAAAEDGDQGRIDRPPAKEERDPSHISLPVDSGIANLYL